jgi:hypothetical protein
MSLRDIALLSAFADEHRGCVTPKQIENLVDTCGGDTDLVDGYDELPAEYQEKVDFALANGHIPDEDCTRVSLIPRIAEKVQYLRNPVLTILGSGRRRGGRRG